MRAVKLLTNTYRHELLFNEVVEINSRVMENYNGFRCTYIIDMYIKYVRMCICSSIVYIKAVIVAGNNRHSKGYHSGTSKIFSVFVKNCNDSPSSH